MDLRLHDQHRRALIRRCFERASEQLVAPLSRALQVRGARSNEIMGDWILGIARIAREHLLGGLVLACGKLQQTLSEAAPRAFETALFLVTSPELSGIDRTADGAYYEIRNDQQQHERDRRHLDETAGEAQRDVTRVGEQQVGDQRAQDGCHSDVETASHRGALIPGPGGQAAIAAALAPIRRCPAAADRC
jgi:hypothetical protein